MLEKKLRSFIYAWKGFQIAVREEFNFRVHIVLALTTILLGLFFRITVTEWLFVIAACGSVLTAELFNTALEELCDMLKPTHDPHVAKIKDLAAAAVFTSAIVAFLIGIVIFAPRIL
jgi:diacylglycerol kinase